MTQSNISSRLIFYFSLTVVAMQVNVSKIKQFWLELQQYTAQKMKFSIKDFLSKYEQIRIFLQIWSHLLERSFMENFIFCVVITAYYLKKKQKMLHDQ